MKPKVPPRKKYNIYAGMWMKLIESVNTEKQAWKVVNQLPLGECYQVTDQDGQIREEFTEALPSVSFAVKPQLKIQPSNPPPNVKALP